MKKLFILLLLLTSSALAENYKFIGQNGLVQRQSDGAVIPNDLGNKDWQAYQVWVASGNVTQAADPLPTPAQILADLRNSAGTELATDTSGNAKLIRAVFLVELDEINLIRSLLVPAQSARTIQQFKTAVQNKITSGAAD